MAGRQFKCGGCGKILEVPASSQQGDPTPRRAPRSGAAAAAAAAADAGHGDDRGDERGGMPVWMQATLLVVGGILLIGMLLLCLGVAPLLWLRGPAGPPVGGPGGGAAFDEVAPAVEPPPVVKPAQKE
jgi:hypothetical protein